MRDPLDHEACLDLAYCYDGTLEGLLTAVFQAYALHEDPRDVLPAGQVQPRLGQMVREIQTDFALAERVKKGLHLKAGRDAFELCRTVGVSDRPDAGTLVYRFVRFAMKTGKAWSRQVMDPAVEPMLAIRRSLGYEKERLLQFIRFKELEGGLWFATCNPKANLVPFVMDHFSDRFNTQSFIIYDEVHHIAGIYDGTEWYLASVDQDEFLERLPPQSRNEARMQQAWKLFYRSVSIDARYNPELRTRWMPKRFWKNLTEVQEELPSLVSRR
ncbi:MAG: TIGR03915 family putative DNA repair protein [Coriobacteriia bacterium]|nr:TIGR03915 family putative DNA repair protein [Coriobacteriia bacterium]